MRQTRCKRNARAAGYNTGNKNTRVYRRRGYVFVGDNMGLFIHFCTANFGKTIIRRGRFATLVRGSLTVLNNRKLVYDFPSDLYCNYVPSGSGTQVSKWVRVFANGAKLAKQSQRRRTNSADRATSQQQRILLLKQVGLEMTLEGAQSRIWCSKIGWQTVPSSWSIKSDKCGSL